MKLGLVNPNTDDSVTRSMCAIAARPGVAITGLTAPFGARLITNEAALAEAGRAVLALAPALQGLDGVIVAAFGDPGLDALRDRLPVPVTGLAEAAMQAAAAGGRRFAVATTTPDLRDAIARGAARAGHTGFAGVWLTRGDPVALTADPVRLVAALRTACEAAIAEGGAEAVIIGGGPLAQAAEALRDSLSVPLIAPIPEAVRLAMARAGAFR
ncbi:MAG: aspartate/glutamate racemase family protein [Rhodobacteraceae bacterium]|jgi:Asp/Glu/hydantoin racemase|nr:aspartate/glutamate racemase family protein [Paracoccaceae bacterium]